MRSPARPLLFHPLASVTSFSGAARRLFGRAAAACVVALALTLVTASYGSITLYDWLALHTIGRKDIPYRIAALASFTSYPIAHGIGAVALISPVIRYRIYSNNGLGALGVANICFLTGLTFWLGNMTALGFSLLYEPAAISVIDRLSPGVNRMIALGLLAGVGAFLAWSWFFPRSIGKSGVPSHSSGGAAIMSSKCCSMWTCNRSPANGSIGDASARKRQARPERKQTG